MIIVNYQHTRKVAVRGHVDGRKSFLRRVYRTILSVSAIKSKISAHRFLGKEFPITNSVSFIQ